MGRSYTYFSSLKLLYSTWNEKEIAHQVMFMPCLLALIKADNFDEAIDFVDLVSNLHGNPVKSKKKYIVVHTPFIDERILENKTGNINAHIISEGEKGKLCQIVVMCK